MSVLNIYQLLASALMWLDSRRTSHWANKPEIISEEDESFLSGHSTPGQSNRKIQFTFSESINWFSELKLIIK